MTEHNNMTGVHILGAPLWDKMASTFQSWVKADHYVGRIDITSENDSRKPTSIWEIISCVINIEGTLRHPQFAMSTKKVDFNLPLVEFLSCNIADSRGITDKLESIVFHDLCFEKIPHLLSEISILRAFSEDEKNFQVMIERIHERIPHPSRRQGAGQASCER